LSKNIKIKRIGIDLDNTIISYDKAFQLAANKFGLISENTSITKENLRNKIRSKENGEEKWQKLQGYVYGEGIGHACLFPGIYRFLWRCFQHNISVEIVSHKTKYGHFDLKKLSLRDAATNFLKDNKLINGSIELISKVTYTDDRNKKINYIKHANFDYFIDDLIEIVGSKEIRRQKNILFSPNAPVSSLSNVHIERSWEGISQLLFGKLTLKEVKLLAETSCREALIKKVEKLKGRGNSSVYKVFTPNDVLFMKVYPQNGEHDRLGSEFYSTKKLNKLGMTNIQKPIGVSQDLGVATYEWVDGNDLQDSSIRTIEMSLEFLRNLHRKRKDYLFMNFPMASDACIRILDIENQINRRLSQLKYPSKKYNNLSVFLNKMFIPVFYEIVSWSKSNLTSEEDYLKPLDKDDMTISPSDFGFHNMITLKDEEVKFIDFEYFGWDDPVKLVSDFSHHAGMSLTEEMEKCWFSGVKSIYGKHCLNRLKISWPLYGLNWCLIILNEFKDDIWNKRCLANDGIKHNREELLIKQLNKSKEKLEVITSSYKNKKYW